VEDVGKARGRDGGNRFGLVEPVANLGVAKLRARRNEHAAELGYRQSGDVELRHVGQAEEDTLAPLDTEAGQCRGKTVGQSVQLTLAENARLPSGVLPE